MLHICIGAVPTGVILAKAFAGRDIRQEGSGNIGATNVTRVLGKKVGALTLVGDLLKGFIPVWAGYHLVSSLEVVCLMGLAAFLGHLFPIYLKFKGGKGVATALGVFLYLSPIVILIEVIIFASAVASGNMCRSAQSLPRGHARAALDIALSDADSASEHCICYINNYKAPQQYPEAPERNGKQSRTEIKKV